MSKEYLLTVCVPTYNRVDYLTRCLQAIMPQLNAEVELVVSDNSTNNETEEYIKQLFEGKENCVYKHNEVNLGADGNFLQCFRMAQGKFIALTGDDDYFAENYIGNLLEFIRINPDVSVIETNSKVFKVPSEILGTGTLKESQTTIYEGIDGIQQFILSLGVFLTFMSTMVFNREILMQVENPEQFNNTYLLQTCILFNMLVINPKAAVLPDTIVYEMVDNGGGYNYYKIFSVNWKNCVKYQAYKKGLLTHKAFHKVINDSNMQQLFLPLLTLKNGKKMGQSTSGKLWYFMRMLAYKTTWTRLLPTLLLPTKIMNKIIDCRNPDDKKADKNIEEK